MRYILSSVLIGFSIFFLGSFVQLNPLKNPTTNLAKAAELPVLKLCNNEDPANNPSGCPPVTNSGKRCGALQIPDPNNRNKNIKNPAQITPSIDLGCRGKGNGILDLIFAIIRILSTGVGLVVIGSMIWAGIQYTSSRGDPQATANAVKRVNSTVLALLIYIFAYALLGWIIPGAILK